MIISFFCLYARTKYRLPYFDACSLIYPELILVTYMQWRGDAHFEPRADLTIFFKHHDNKGIEQLNIVYIKVYYKIIIVKGTVP